MKVAVVGEKSRLFKRVMQEICPSWSVIELDYRELLHEVAKFYELQNDATIIADCYELYMSICHNDLQGTPVLVGVEPGRQLVENKDIYTFTIPADIYDIAELIRDNLLNYKSTSTFIKERQT